MRTKLPVQRRRNVNLEIYTARYELSPRSCCWLQQVSSSDVLPMSRIYITDNYIWISYEYHLLKIVIKMLWYISIIQMINYVFKLYLSLTRKPSEESSFHFDKLLMRSKLRDTYFLYVPVRIFRRVITSSYNLDFKIKYLPALSRFASGSLRFKRSYASMKRNNKIS